MGMAHIRAKAQGKQGRGVFMRGFVDMER